MRTMGLCLALWATAGLWAAPAAEPPQVPLCMIGDSITWADQGDWWRGHLIELLPNLAFVGTHSATLGYSHAGEGGNSTRQILGRMTDIPDCAYYHLLIGTNDNNLKDAAKMDAHAAATAGRILDIVTALLQKPSAQRVFLGSILPCHTDNPLRDQTNHRTNELLRERLAATPNPKVTWVEYEQPVRATPNWEPLIRLHPTKDGYRIIAKVLADSLRRTLSLPDQVAAPRPQPGGGVYVTNLLAADGAGWVTTAPVIAGWYTLSFTVAKLAGGPAKVVCATADDAAKAKIRKEFALPANSAGQRLSFEVFTNYEGYGYTRARLGLTVEGAQLEQVLFEKKRPSGKPSVYGAGRYLDTATPPAPGELIER